MNRKERIKKVDKLHSEFGFTIPIPDEVIQSLPDIGSAGLAMFCYLMYRTYNDKRTQGEISAWPNLENMLIQTGMAPQEIQKGLKALEDNGFLPRREEKKDE